MNQSEVSSLTSELRDQIEMLPTNIERSEALLKAETMKLEKLFGVQNSVERVEDLQSNLIPKLKTDIKKIEMDLSAAQERIKQSQRAIEDPKDKQNVVTQMIGDMSILDDAIRDIEQTRTELMPLRSSLPAGEGQADYNLDNLQKKRKELTDSIKKLEFEIESKDKRCQEDVKRLTLLKEKEMTLKDKELELKGDIQKRDVLMEREKELTEQIKQLQEKKEESDQLLIPIGSKIRLAEDKRRRMKESGAEKLNAATKRTDGFKKTFDSIERVSKDLDRLASLNLAAEIERSQATLARLRDEQKKQVTRV